MSTEDEREPIITPLAGGGYHIDEIGPGKSVELEFKFGREIEPERRAEIRDEKLPMLPPKSPRYRAEEHRADRAEARLRSEVESFGVRERSGPPIMGIVVIYLALISAVGFAIWFAGNGYGWW